MSSATTNAGAAVKKGQATSATSIRGRYPEVHRNSWMFAATARPNPPIAAAADVCQTVRDGLLRSCTRSYTMWATSTTPLMMKADKRQANWIRLELAAPASAPVAKATIR